MPWLSNGLRRFDVEEGSPAFERLKKQGYEEEIDPPEPPKPAKGKGKGAEPISPRDAMARGGPADEVEG